MTDYLFDKQGDDPEVAKLEALLGVYAHDAPLRRAPRRLRWIVPLVAAVAAAAAVALWLGRDPSPQLAGAPPAVRCAPSISGFPFEVQRGDARCAGAATRAGTLPVGTWLEVDRDGVTAVQVADIGELIVFGDSRLRLVGTDADEHRIELARGRLSASVVAPPRLFVIDTPVGAAVDLGCAYELEVDDAGRTHLAVTSGEVSLESKAGVIAYVPMGTEVFATRDRGPGTPTAVDAAPALRAAVARFDAGEPDALTAILASAGPRDLITLWNLLARAPDRAAVARALHAHVPRPTHVSEDAILARDPAALAAWHAAVTDRWFAPFEAPPPPPKKPPPTKRPVSPPTPIETSVPPVPVDPPSKTRSVPPVDPPSKTRSVPEPDPGKRGWSKRGQ